MALCTRWTSAEVPMMAAIPTIYRDIEYRSRGEARWAAFFDRMGWRHTYEPFDADGYIPDFAIHGTKPLIVEVKPTAVAETDYWSHVSKVATALIGHWEHSIFIAGASPFEVRQIKPGLAREIDGVRAPDDLPDHIFQDRDFGLSAGLLASRPLPHSDGWEFGHGWWHRTSKGVTLRGLYWIPAVNGEMFGTPEPLSSPVSDQLQAGEAPGDFMSEELQQAWAEACNDVKWRGRDA